jgi:hypothetical protein
LQAVDNVHENIINGSVGVDYNKIGGCRKTNFVAAFFYIATYRGYRD